MTGMICKKTGSTRGTKPSQAMHFKVFILCCCVCTEAGAESTDRLARTSDTSARRTGCSIKHHWFCYICAFSFSLLRKVSSQHSKTNDLSENFLFMKKQTMVLNRTSTAMNDQLRVTTVAGRVKLLRRGQRRGADPTVECFKAWHVESDPSQTVPFARASLVGKADRPAGHFRTVRQAEELPLVKLWVFGLSCRTSPSSQHTRRLYSSRTEVYSFHTHKLLRINVTVLELDTLSSSTAKCTLDFVSVQCFPATNNQLEFCGKRSLINIYPVSNIVQVKEHFYVPLKSKRLQFVYSVMDLLTMVSLPLSSRAAALYGHSALLLHTYSFAEGVVSQEYLLTARHFEHFVITVLESQKTHVEIWDGPGKRSKKISGTNSSTEGVFSSSAFLAFVLRRWSWGTNQTLAFSTKSLQCSTVLSVDTEKQLSFPYLNMNKVHCITTRAPANLTLNVTFSGYQTQGDDANGAQCQWAGVAAYNKPDDEDHFQLITVECVKVLEGHSFEPVCSCAAQQRFSLLVHTNEKHKTLIAQSNKNKDFVHPTVNSIKSVYSTTNTVVLIWYSFVEYGSLSLNVSLSTTTCKATTVEVGSLDPDMDIPLPTTCSVYFSVEHCTIVQVSDWSDRFRLSAKCVAVRVVVEQAAPEILLFSLSATGFVEGNFVGSKHRNCVTFLFYQSESHFTVLCVFLMPENIKTCGISVCREREDFPVSAHETSADVSSALSSSSLNSQGLWFCFGCRNSSSFGPEK